MTDSSDEPIHPLEKLKQQAEEAQKRREKEVVACPECGTELLKDSIEEAVDTADKHDEKRHDGEPTTKVNGIVPPQFTEDQKEEIQDAVRSLQADADQSDGTHRKDGDCE